MEEYLIAEDVFENAKERTRTLVRERKTGANIFKGFATSFMCFNCLYAAYSYDRPRLYKLENGQERRRSEKDDIRDLYFAYKKEIDAAMSKRILSIGKITARPLLAIGRKGRRDKTEQQEYLNRLWKRATNKDSNEMYYNVLITIYEIRCNAIHGSKDLGDPDNKMFMQESEKILDEVIKAIIK